MKYDLSNSQNEILPNLLELTSVEEVGLSEFEGFLKAEIFFTEHLEQSTRFSLEYILRLLKEALRHLYPFAGNLRTVNMSKGGFVFPAAKFLANSMKDFEREILSQLRNSYKNRTNSFMMLQLFTVNSFLSIHLEKEMDGQLE